MIISNTQQQQQQSTLGVYQLVANYLRYIIDLEAEVHSRKKNIKLNFKIYNECKNICNTYWLV